jgi:outer membrane lipoprotein-sorting protein
MLTRACLPPLRADRTDPNMNLRPLGISILLVVAALTVWRGAKYMQDRRPRMLFHKSVTLGADVPMRADLIMTWRRHGITHTTQAHVVHGVKGQYRMEYVQPAAAKGRVVYSNGQTQWQYEPRRNLLATTNLVPESEQNERDTEDLVARNYKIVLVSEDETTTGRPSSLLELLPRQEGKSSQKRWIDRQTFKTLRIETHYPDGILARRIAYTSVVLPAQVASRDFAPPTSPSLRRVTTPASSNILPMHDQTAPVRSLGLRAEAALGFQLTQVASSPVEEAQTAHLLYSDGIESVSVFVQNGGPPVLAKAPGWHTVNIAGRPAFENRDGHLDAVVWTQGSHRYTAVSHLEPKALQRFVSSQIEGNGG